MAVSAYKRFIKVRTYKDHEATTSPRIEENTTVSKPSEDATIALTQTLPLRRNPLKADLF
jgi:hypothetical protein